MAGFVPFLCPASCVKFWTRTACAAMLMPGLCTHTALTLSVLILGLCMCIHVQPVQFVVCAISTAGTTELKSNTINVFLEVQMWDHVFANLVIRILFVLIFWCIFFHFCMYQGTVASLDIGVWENIVNCVCCPRSIIDCRGITLLPRFTVLKCPKNIDTKISKIFDNKLWAH